MVSSARTTGFALLLALLLAVTVLAGCTSAPDDGAPAPQPEATEDPDAADAALGRFFGFVSGVETIQLDDPQAAPVATGAVFTADTGQALAGAIVAVQCVLATGTAAPDLSAVTQTDPEGRFSVSDLSPLLPCASLRFSVQAAGYDMVVPLEAEGADRGVQYVVSAAMEEA